MNTQGVAVAFEHRDLPQLLLLARDAVIARFRPLLKANGLTEQQWRILRALADEGPLEPRQIVRNCGISSPSLAGVLARMDDLGLVRRKRADHDARRVTVSLTPRSGKLTRRLASQIDAVYFGIEAQLDPDFIRQLCSSLAVLTDRIEVREERKRSQAIPTSPTT